MNYNLTKEFLYQKHITEGKTAVAISKEVECSEQTIRRNLKKFKIPITIPSPPINFNYKNIKDMIFGDLTVIERVDKNNKIYWKCQCLCGKLKIIKSSSLLKKKQPTKSCGCHKVIAMKKRAKGFKELNGTYWCRIIAGAKSRKLDFDINIEYAWEIFENQRYLCSISGVPISMSPSNCPQTASLDRIDSSKGYIIGNIQWIHKDINYMKWAYNQKFFIDWCKIIANYNKDNND